MCRDIGHIQRHKGRNGGGAVVIGGPAHKAEARQRHQCIHRGTLGGLEIGVDRGAAIKPTGKGRNAGNPLRLECADHGVIMRGIRRQHIGPQHQQTHGQLGIGRARQVRQGGGDPVRKGGVIQAHIRIIDRSLGYSAAPVLARGIAPDQKPDHLFDIVVRAAQPILHRQKPSPHVLRLARNPAQDFGKATQHRHLLFARVGRCFRAGLQLFQQGHRRRGGLGHIQIAHLRQLDDRAIRDDPDEGIGTGAGGGQVGQDRVDMFFDEDQVRENDISGLERQLGAGQRSGVFGPFRGGMDGNRQAREILGKTRRDARSRTGGMAVQRHDDDVIAHAGAGQRRVSAHNVPLPHTGFRC